MLQRIQRFWRRLFPYKPYAACGYCGAQCLKTTMTRAIGSWFCSPACADKYMTEEQRFSM